MAIDARRLLNGEEVICDKCHKGRLKPRFTDDPTKASSFVCPECGTIVRYNFKSKKPSE